MTTQFSVLNDREQKAIISVCILAAFADGAVSEQERSEIKRIVENFSTETFDLTSAYQQALAGRLSLADLARDLQSPNSKALAQEMAICICNCDHPLSEPEQKFLTGLRAALNLDAGMAADFLKSAAALRDEPPVIATLSNRSTELDQMIRDRAVLTGALELMPHTLATMAIVPIQLRLVYQIGRHYGHQLDLSHTKEFLATLGVGITSHMVDGYLSKIVGSVTRRFAGRFIGALAAQATESAISFATTYAIGQVAKKYYESGRTLSTDQLRDVFSTMLNQGRSMQSQYASQISQRASSMKVTDFLPLLRT